VADLLRQVNGQVDFLCRKLTPAGYLALHLVAGASFIIAFTWCFGAIASNASSHHYLLALDHKILSWFSEHATRSLIDFATRVAYFGSSPSLAVASLVTAVILISRKSWDHLLLLFLTMVGGALLCFLLRISHWPLPLLEDSFAILPSERFPSWHAMGSTLFCGFIAALVGAAVIELRWRALTLFVAALIVLLIALTRIYVGSHYVTDVVGAIAAGLAWLIWCQLGVELMQRAFAAGPSSSSASSSSFS
jgi:undecaprenyl-diphosphatase